MIHAVTPVSEVKGVSVTGVPLLGMDRRCALTHLRRLSQQVPLHIRPAFCTRSDVDRTFDGYVISTDRAQLDIALIQRFLANDSYWAQGIPRAVVEQAVRHSLCFGVYTPHGQVGFARVVTDYATYGYIMDVFVLPEHRGKGLSKRLMECIMTHPELQGFRRWQLGTRDAHGLYAQFGFATPVHPERSMERTDPDVYLRTIG